LESPYGFNKIVVVEGFLQKGMIAPFHDIVHSDGPKGSAAAHAETLFLY
jgi:hypothetical protein